MEPLVLVEGVLEERDLVLEVGLLQQPFVVLAQYLILLGVLVHQSLNFLCKG
jgi:hypothetical protein